MIKAFVKVVPAFSSFHDESIVLLPVFGGARFSILFENSGLGWGKINQIESFLFDMFKIVFQSLDYHRVENIRYDSESLLV